MMRLLLILVALAIAGAAMAQGYPPQTPRPSSGGGTTITAGEVVSMVADAGTLARADQDLYVNAIHLQGKAPDGGSAVQVLSVNQPIATFKMSSGSQAEINVNGNEATFNFAASRFSTMFMAGLSCSTGASCFETADTGRWVRSSPTTDVSGCVSNTEGGRRWNSTSKRPIWCDGTNVVTGALKGGPWSAALDFPAFANSTCEVLTFSATGAVLDEPVVPGGCGTVVGTDKDLRCNAVVSTSNQVSIQICCEDSAGCADLPSLTFSASALR